MNMKTDSISFTGLGAMPIKAIVARDIGSGVPFAKVIKEVTDIADKNGIDVFVQNKEKLMRGKDYSFNPEKAFPNEFYFPWAQDNLTFTPDGKMLANYFLRTFNSVIENCVKRPIQDLKYHIQGGNFFIIKEGQKNSVIIGKDEMNYYRPESIKRDFGVSKIYPVSQPDFHLDLGVRPLKDKTVLVNDDGLTFAAIDKAIKSSNTYLYEHNDPEIEQVKTFLKNLKKCFVAGRKENKYKNDGKTAKELKEYGFNAVKVPGLVIRPKFGNDINDETHYMANFMNAIVHEKQDGSLVYITNKSMLDKFAGITPEVEQKIGFSFHKMFKDSIKDYVSEDNIHFIDGDGYIQRHLDSLQGGIHCLFAEVPVIK